jgi:hypothetical protein
MNGSANGGISADYPFARVKAASDAGAGAAQVGGSARPVLIIAITRGNQARGGRHHSRAATYFFRPSIP